MNLNLKFKNAETDKMECGGVQAFLFDSALTLDIKPLSYVQLRNIHQISVLGVKSAFQFPLAVCSRIFKCNRMYGQLLTGGGI